MTDNIEINDILTDEQENNLLDTQKPFSTPEKALLFGLDTSAYDAEKSMTELGALCQARALESVAEVLQKRERPEAATVLGKGRLEEARQLAEALGADIAVFDGELSGSQIRNLEKILNIPVIDRTLLILEIFKSRATSAEGKTQTELAELEYRLPRLAGLGTSLSRQGGGTGGGAGARRGGGETKLEYDRRYIRSRIAILKKRLSAMQAARGENRRARQKSGVPVIAVVGYTNVGKSSLVNALVSMCGVPSGEKGGANIAVADMLFATLDPSARAINLPDGQNAVIVDTVGFVSRLPHNLVDAFKSTLEEAAYSDLIIKVCDASDIEAEEQLKITSEVLASLGCADYPTLTLYNKIDKPPAFTLPQDILTCSTKTGEGLDTLLEKIADTLSARVRKISVLLPYSEMSLADTFRKFGTVLQEDFREDGVFLQGSIIIEKLHLFSEYII